MKRSEQRLQEIKRDHRSGAIALTLKAGEALLNFLQEHNSRSIRKFAQELIKAQPAMASIRNLVMKVLSAIEEGNRSASVQIIEEFTRALKAGTRQIAQHAVELIPSSATVMTISRSSMFLKTCELAKRQGNTFSVICPESRPLNEGVYLARELARIGVSVTLCVDALAPSLVRDCDLVLVSGDALAPEGLINKIGTYPLALAAHAAGVPVVALIHMQKFLPRFDLRWIPEMEPDEVMDKPLENVYVCNRYFDLTPLKLIKNVVTGQGIYSSSEIQELIVGER